MDLGNLVIAPPTVAGPASTFDARWKLAAIGLAVAGTLCLHTLAGAAAALAGSIALAVWARLSLRWVGARLAIILPLLFFFTVPLPLLLQDQGPSWHWAVFHVSLHGINVALLL